MRVTSFSGNTGRGVSYRDKIVLYFLFVDIWRCGFAYELFGVFKMGFWGKIFVYRHG